MASWQPIETAPLDGTEVDLWAHWPETGARRRVADAFFSVDHDDWQLGQYRRFQFAHPPILTHWMPKPESPRG